MNHKEVVDSIQALHTHSTILLLTLARGGELAHGDKQQIRFFPRIALNCLVACGVPIGPREKICQMDATTALVKLHEKTASMLGDCARYTPAYAITQLNPHILHTLTLELCSALGLEPK